MYKKVNLKEKEYDKIKALQSVGVSGTKIAALLQRSPGLVFRVWRSPNFAAFTAANAKRAASALAQRHAKDPGLTTADEIAAIFADSEPTKAQPTIIQITCGFVNGSRVFGLGTDNQVYFYSSEGWKAFTPLVQSSLPVFKHAIGGVQNS